MNVYVLIQGVPDMENVVNVSHTIENTMNFQVVFFLKMEKKLTIDLLKTL